MTSRKALLDVLLAAGVADADAEALATLQPAPGGSWTNEVLSSGKVDEIKFAVELAGLGRAPFENIEQVRVDRAVLQLLPSRYVFKYHLLPIAATETTVRLATYDIFNLVARR